MAMLVVPRDVEAVFQQVRTCEFTTLAKDNTPITWKAYNLRRTPKVAMLYSDPTGSGLAAPPAVLVQGEAVCPDRS
jgi:hypothetical protein